MTAQHNQTFIKSDLNLCPSQDSEHSTVNPTIAFLNSSNENLLNKEIEVFQLFK